MRVSINHCSVASHKDSATKPYNKRNQVARLCTCLIIQQELSPRHVVPPFLIINLVMVIPSQIESQLLDLDVDNHVIYPRNRSFHRPDHQLSVCLVLGLGLIIFRKLENDPQGARWRRLLDEIHRRHSPFPPYNERPETRASECRQRVEIVRADAHPAARERHLRGVEAADEQYGADDGADEGAVCEEEYFDYVCSHRLLSRASY